MRSYDRGVLTADLIRLYPRLFHMAGDGSWPSIRGHGLLSTNALVARWEVPQIQREALVAQVRSESRLVEHPRHGVAVVRDQKPIHEESLAAALTDMTVAAWLHELNDRAFFFLQPERLQTLMNARSYRRHTHVVLTIDTASIVARYEDDIQLCAINSGFAQRHSRAPRGRDTFRPIRDYPHPARQAPRTKAPWDVAELAVRGGVPDIATHAIRVDRMRGGEVLEQLA